MLPGQSLNAFVLRRGQIETSSTNHECVVKHESSVNERYEPNAMGRKERMQCSTITVVAILGGDESKSLVHRA